MRRTVLIFVFLILIISTTDVPCDSKLDLSLSPISVAISSFENTTGDPGLDWVGPGLQEAFICDLTYLKGFDIEDIFGISPKKKTIEEMIEYAKNQPIPTQQIWIGKYWGDSKEMTVEITIVHVDPQKVLVAKRFKAPLNGFLKEASMTVLEIANGLGIVVDDEEKQRVLSQKTGSVDAWRLNVEALMPYRNDEDVDTKDESKEIEMIIKSEKILVEATSLDPNYAEAWNNLGMIYGGTEQWEKALKVLKKALDIKPYLILANMGMGASFKKKGDNNEALEYYKKLVNINPSLRGPLHEIFSLLTEIGKKEEARSFAVKLLKNPSSIARQEAIGALATLEEKSSIPLLIEMLKDPDKDVCGSAINTLGHIGNKSVVPALISMRGDTDRRIRVTVAVALRDIGDKSALPVLIEMLTDPDKDVRHLAVWALAAIGDKSAVPALFKALKDRDKKVQISAVRALAEMGEKTGIEILIEALKDPDEQLRVTAAYGLKGFHDASAVPPLIEALKDKNMEVRIAAAVALGEIGDKRAIPGLVEAVKYMEDFRFADALGKIGDGAAVTALILALKDPDKKVRENAANALGAICDKAAVPALIEALEDPEIWVRARAVLALKKIKDNSAIFALNKMLKDIDPNVRGYAAEALGELGDRSVVPLLVEALKDPSGYARGCAAEALGKIGDPSAIPELLKTLKDNDESVRKKVAEALGKMGNREGIPVLINALNDEQRWWRMEAGKTLGKLGEASGLYEDFHKSSDIFIFSQIRKNLLFPTHFEILTNSENLFLKSSGYYLLSLKAREAGRYKDQLEQVNQALKHINSMDKTALAVLCYWLKTQGELKLNKPKDALESIRKAEGLLDYLSKKEKEDYEELFEEFTLFLKGEVLIGAGDSKSAIKSYEEALEKLERSKRKYKMGEIAQKLEVMVQTNLGALQIKTGKENLEKAVEGGRNFQASDSVEMENEEKRYMELARQKIAEGNYEESQKLLEELNLRRTNYINRKMKISLADTEKQGQINEFRKKQEEIESIGKRIEALGKDKKGAGESSQAEDEIKRLEKERNDKRRELQVYLTNLKKTHPDLAALMGAKPLELITLQEQLPEDTAILQYLMLPDKLIVFVIRSKGIDIVETQIKRSELKERVEALRKAIYAKAEGENSRMIKPLSRELYGMLISPIEEGGKLKGVKVIGIAPNSFLHQLPFGVLIDPEAKYLVDRYTLFYMNSTSILGVAMERSRQKVSGENIFLAISNPDGSLNYADMEVADISKLFGKKTIYSKKEAKKDVIQNKQKDYSILHLSTHGIFDPIDSTRSYLLMADGKLTIEEIWGLPLKGTTLTVLSACETGVGEVLSGDDVVSLENAFIFAGSPTVIATLWNVADQSTAELMSFFYQNLLKGKTKAEALTEAQRQLRERYDHPFFWSAFTLRGDWR